MDYIKKIEKYKEQVKSIKEEMIKRILSIVNDCGGEMFIADIDEGESPIVKYDETEGYNGAYTLDNISTDKSGKVLFFDCSSSFDNCTIKDKDMQVETLIDIFEFLVEHEEEINDLA